MAKLCKSHLTQLGKVSTQLANKQTMGFTPLLLSEKNFGKIFKAKEHINEAIEILKTVK